MARYNKNETRGFTLIELLVVIAIIAILAAILFPVFARAREKARESSCLSDEKQILTALNAYTQDFDEHYPAQAGDSNCCAAMAAGGTTPTYYDQLMPYIKSAQVWRCPDSIGNALMSYHMSGDVITSDGLPLGRVASPATCPVIRDAGNGTTYNIAYRRPYLLGQPGNWSSGCDDYYNSNNMKAGPHTDGGANHGFCDGHAKYASQRQIVGLATFLVTDSTPDCLNPP